ncbi:MAG: asparagine synthase-related protein [Bacteroidetes bacterium]|nr:asparagine synthase-related protein [Bacteroidota bacterium]
MNSIQPYIFGLFDPQGQITRQMNTSQMLGQLTGRILSNGYVSGKKGDRQVYIYSRIYNLEEVRKQIGSAQGNSADLILDIFDREGVKGFRRLNGKFTIIICEPERIIIIRDRNGEGRMVYYTKDFFTDSYQGLSLFKGFKAVPDLTGITTFLKIGYIPAPVTSLEGVSKIPAGEILYVTGKGLNLEKLFDFEEIRHHERKEIPVNEAIENYADLLKKSLIRRIGSADTVGALLSGGYDSGGNIAMLREVHPGKIKTYSIGFKDNPASELPYTKMMAEKFGAEHSEYLMDGTEIEYLPDIIDSLGDPFSESGFMLNHSAMKMVAGENLDVTIGGDGNDQYFGAGIRETALRYKMQRFGLTPFSKALNKLSDNSLFDLDNLAFRIHFQNQKILDVMEPETFGLHDYQLNRIFNMESIPPHPYLKEIPRHFKSYEELWLQRNYYLHIRHSVNEVIIFKASRLSESFGVHLAFSYTDLDIYNFLQGLPISLRAKGTIEECMKGKGITKFIHKQLVKPMLPAAVTNRPKQGGFSPLEIFFNDKTRRENIYRYIRNSAFAATLKTSGFLDAFFEQYERLSTGKTYWFWYKQVKSNQMLNLLIITLWWDRVLQGKKSGKLSDYIG